MPVNTHPLTVTSADGTSTHVDIAPRADGTVVVRVYSPFTFASHAAVVDVRQLLQACGRALDTVYKMEDAG